ncbi:MAG: hypothetical protein ACOX6H_03025 [Christensenellales bacterium]|jgi:uncharacterized coiled-coil protein SlyX
MKVEKRLEKIEQKMKDTEIKINDISEILNDKNLPLEQFKKLFKTKNALIKKLDCLKQKKQAVLKIVYFNQEIGLKKDALKNPEISEDEKKVLRQEIEALEKERFEHLFPVLGFALDFVNWFPVSQEEELNKRLSVPSENKIENDEESDKNA